MTQKRFTMHKDYGIHDHYKSIIHDVETYSGILDVITELNELYNENKELKGKASSWKITASEEIFEKEGLIKQIVELKEENKQLQQELFESQVDYYTETFRDDYEDRIIDLKKEFKERFGRDFEYD